MRPVSDLVWTPAELAEQFGVSEQLIRDLLAEGRIPHVRLSPQRRIIPKAALNEWLADEARSSTLMAELEALR